MSNGARLFEIASPAETRLYSSPQARAEPAFNEAMRHCGKNDRQRSRSDEKTEAHPPFGKSKLGKRSAKPALDDEVNEIK